MNPTEKIKITIEDVYNLVELNRNDFLQHTEDDKRAFGHINAKLEKREQIAEQNGEHMSNIGLRLATIEKVQSEQAKMHEEQIHTNKTILQHIEDIKPIIQNYKDVQATKRVFTKYGKGAVWVSTVIGALYLIKEFIRNKVLN